MCQNFSARGRPGGAGILSANLGPPYYLANHRRKRGENIGGALQNESVGLGDTVPQWGPGAKIDRKHF